MDKIWHYHLDCGRMGYIEGMFVAAEEEIENNVGLIVNFGEALGKHSEITTTFNWDDIEELTDDQDLIEKCVNANIVPNGYNPLDYIYEEEEEDDEDAD